MAALAPVVVLLVVNAYAALPLATVKETTGVLENVTPKLMADVLVLRLAVPRGAYSGVMRPPIPISSAHRFQVSAHPCDVLLPGNL